jgi:glucokinase
VVDKNAGLFVGVDVGGTNIASALVRGAGDIVARNRQRTPRTGSAEKTLAAILRSVDKLLEKGKAKPTDVEAVGLGVAGTVDPTKGLVVDTPNMKLSGLKVVAPAEKHFGVPVALGNDVNVGTLGEYWLGAARGAASVMGIFWGTGIGGGVIVDGRLLLGARSAAGEIGHVVMEIDGPVCGCGNRGCLEAIASRTAIERDLRKAAESGRETALTDILKGDFSIIRSGSLKKALAKDDALVKEVLDRAAVVLGHACLTVRHLLDPEVIVLGGGVVEACGKYLVPRVASVLDADNLGAGGASARLVPSELGDDAGVLGAAALAQQHVGITPVADVDGPGGSSPVINDSRFGAVTVCGETYEKDIYIRANGKVKKRKKKAIKKRYGTSHCIGPEELEKVCKGDPEVLIVGTGQEGSAALTDDGAALLKERGISVTAVPTPQAVDLYNQTEGRKAAIIHVTC